MLARSTIIQLGDVHYPTHPREHFLLDNQDPGFSSRVAVATRIPAHRVLERELSREVSLGDFEFLILMGDLTDRGSSSAYKECLDYILTTFIHSKPISNNLGSLVVLPGNHDVDRKKLSDSADTRFSSIKSILEGGAITQFPESSHLHVLGTRGPGTTISLTAINTCIGCGERRNYPGDLVTLLEQFASARAKKSILQHLDPYESLDTPAFDTAKILEHVNEIRALPVSAMPVFCGHHNILPQMTPRMKVYTEMINAGLLREALLSLNRPVLYLHGHTHDFSVDVISNPEQPKARIINVSAPQLRDGFNKISIISNGAGIPLGVEITNYLSAQGVVADPRVFRIPLWPITELSAILSPAARRVEGSIPYQAILYFSDLCQKCSSLGLTENEIATCVHELLWTGLIKVDNMDGDRIYWRVSKSVGN